MRTLRQALKYLLPHGVVEISKNCRRLRALGGRIPVRSWWRSEWLVHEAEASGLDLLPAGHWRNLRTVVDVGANVGQWSTMLLDLVTPEKLIIVEPQPAAFRKLQQRFGNRSAIELHAVAIGDVDGTTKFQVTRDTTGASVLPPRDEMRELIGSNWTVESQIEVPIKRLDTLLSHVGEISLLKIDVQGFEQAVIAGATQSLARTNFLLIELNYMQQYEGGSWFGEIHELLTREHGFALVDASKPLRLNGRASMSDGLYVNTRRLPDFAPREFV
ncbi:MAG TPA: FkbM family methyltransferase [Chthoniobacterales bacterium]|nr:FkbM family methyltransferase [Chthoniobacterales bacterium]